MKPNWPLLLSALMSGVVLSSEKEDDDVFAMSLEELRQIKITSTTKTDVSVAQAPATVTVLTRADLDAFHFESLADVLRVQAGVNVLYDWTLFNVGMRGIAGGYAAQGQSIKVMIDGQDMSLPTTATSLVGLEFMPTFAIERIEIVRGPLSTLYGADAFTGVINVVPRSAKGMKLDDWSFEWQQQRAQRDDLWTDNTELTLARRGEQWSVFAALAINNGERQTQTVADSSPRFTSLANNPTDSDNSRTQTAYVALSTENDWGRWQIDYSHQALYRGAPYHPDSEPLRDARIGLAQNMARLRWHRPWSERLTSHVTVAMNDGGPDGDNRLYDPYRFTTDYLYRDYAFRQYNSSVDAEYNGDNFTINGGMDYRFDRETLPTLVLVNSDGTRDEHNGDRTIEIDNVGSFVQWLGRPLSELQLSAGLRRDDHSLFGRHDSYRAGLVYQMFADTHFKLLSGTAFKAPPPMLLFGGEHPRLLGPAPNPALQPQTSKTVELSVDRQWQNLHAALTLYRTRIADYAEYDTIAANPQARNRGRIDARGLELEWRYRLPAQGLALFINASWIDTTLSTDIPVGIDVSSRSRLYPARSISGGISYNGQHWPFKAFLIAHSPGARYADKSNLAFLPLGQQQEYELPGYTLIDAGISTERWPLLSGRRTEWALIVRNADNRNYNEPGFSGIDVPGLHRSWQLSLRQQF